MNLLETFFWNVLFWALYLPTALIALLVSAKGHPVGILVCGIGGSAILSAFLAFQGNILFRPYNKACKTAKKEPEKKCVEPEAPEVKDEKMEVENPKDEVVAEATPNTAAKDEFSEEPEPRIRSDADLDELDADDDESFSKCD